MQRIDIGLTLVGGLVDWARGGVEYRHIDVWSPHWR